MSLYKSAHRHYHHHHHPSFLTVFSLTIYLLFFSVFFCKGGVDIAMLPVFQCGLTILRCSCFFDAMCLWHVICSVRHMMPQCCHVNRVSVFGE